MKAKIIAFLFSLIAIAPLSAQQYRGFFDLYGVGCVKGLPGDFVYYFSDIDKGKDPQFGFGAMTSHGVQFHKLFVGAGVGFIHSNAKYGDPTNAVPVFADVRWDFFGTRGVNPFVGLRLGYSISIGEEYLREIEGPTNSKRCFESHEPSFYFQPTVGMRIRTAPKFGLNISLSYFPLKQVIKDYDYSNANSDWNSAEIIKYYTKGYLALGVGFDF